MKIKSQVVLEQSHSDSFWCVEKRFHAHVLGKEKSQKYPIKLQDAVLVGNLIDRSAEIWLTNK